MQISENNDFTKRLEAIIDTAIDGIITMNDKGIVESINPSAAKIFGYAPEEVIGNNVNMLMPPPTKREHDQYIKNYLETKTRKIIGIGREVLGKKQNGEIFPFRLAVSEVKLDDRIIFTGIIHDLSEVTKAREEIQVLNKQLEIKVGERTYELEKVVNQLLNTNAALENEIKERKEIENRLKENEEELIQSLEKEKELSELKSRFVTTASHEFRTPLTSILSSASLIGKYPEAFQQANREKHIERIKSAVTNLTGILNDFLSLSKLEEGKFTVNFGEVKLEKLCMEVSLETKGMLKDGQIIEHNVIGEDKTVFSDERILKNILFNLISNAIKYSDATINCHIVINEENFEIHIKDRGIGIPVEDQKHLFTRFFRAGNVTNIQGTGLGLNIVRRYVDLLKGQISFESIHEEGTTFSIIIPLNKLK